MNTITKRCTQCSLELFISDFSPQKFGKYGVKSWCKQCSNKHNKIYSKKNAAKRNEYNRKWAEKNWDKFQDRKFVYKYGISYSVYLEMLDEQNNVCAICAEPESRTTKNGQTLWLSVDHDHSCCLGEKSCGKCVRGLLCWRCNTSIGKFNDDVYLIEKIITYLKRKRK